MSLLSSHFFPDSQAKTYSGSFFLDGLHPLTDAEVFAVKSSTYDFEVKEIGLRMSAARTAGILTLEIKLNGTPVPGGVLLINGANPLEAGVDGMSVRVLPDTDVLTVHITTSSFTPLANSGSFYILTK